MDEQERLILRAALSPPPIAIAAWRTFRSAVPQDEASPLLSWAAGYVHENLHRAGLSDRYLWGIYQHNLITNSSMLTTSAPCIRDLSQSMRVIRLKSFARVSTGEKLGSRPVADLDILVERQSLRKAVALLGRYGFSPGLGASLEEFWNRIYPQRSSWGFSNDGGASIDIHWAVFDHLKPRADRSITRRSTRRITTAEGAVNVLDAAVEVSLLAIQHRLQFTRANHLLIDIHRLAQLTTIEEVLIAARQADALEWVKESFAALRDVLAPGLSHLNDLERLIDKSPMAPLEHNHEEIPARPPSGYISRTLWGKNLFKRILRFLWWSAGASPRAETILIRAFNGLSPDRIPESTGTWCFDASTSEGVGPGWSYRFPGRQTIWSRYPEGRLRFESASRGLFQIDIRIDVEEWARHPLREVGIYINGVLIQIVEKNTQHVSAQFRNNLSVAELSIRRVNRQHFTQPGIFHEWYYQMLPVSEIRLQRLSE